MDNSPSFKKFCKRVNIDESEIIAILKYISNSSDHNSRKQLY